jgi:hypothetical protein
MEMQTEHLLPVLSVNVFPDDDKTQAEITL